MRAHDGLMRVALYQPDIAPNVGAVLRLAACLAVPVDLIEPFGFIYGDARFRRAGMDYLDRVTVVRHAGWSAFAAAPRGRLVLLTTKAAERLDHAVFRPDDTLLFGRESAGVPDAVHAAADLRVRIPMAPGCRSLNMALAVAIVLGEALRQTGRWPQDQSEAREQSAE